MKTINKNLGTRVFAVLLSILLSSPYAFAGEVGRVTYVEGRADILRPDSDMAAPIREGGTVSVGDAIRTKSNSKAEVVFNDNTVLRIAQNSKVDIQDYQLDKDNKRKTASIKLERGKARTIISKMPDAADFNIRTPNAEGKVRGSDIFAFYQAGNSGMLVADGKLSVINIAHPEKPIVVQAGNSILVPLEELPKEPRAYFGLEKKLHEQDTNVPVSRIERGTIIKGVVTKVSGSVKITAKGQTAPHDASINEIVSEGDRIETGANGLLELKFDNGNAINLKPGSNLLIGKLVFDPATGEYENLFESSVGKIRARIENLKGKSRFEVKTPTAVSGARGTIMYLEVTPTSVRAFFEGGNGFITNLISGLEKTVAAGENAYANNQGAVSDPTPTPAGERESFGEGWDPGNGTEGYSAPEGTVGVYLSTSDTGTTNIVAGPEPAAAPETGGTEPFNNLPFEGTGPTTPTTIVTVPTTSSGFLHSDITSYGTYAEGTFEGIIAILNNFWNGAQATFLSAGDFSSNGYDPFIWYGARNYDYPTDYEGYLYSYDPGNGTYTTYDGGAFYGVALGTGVNGGLDGFAKVIYIDPNLNAGIAGGDLVGTYSNLPDGTGAYVLAGTLSSEKVFGNIGIAPEALYDSLYSNEGEGYLYGSFGGDSGESDYIEGYDNFQTISIVNYKKGVAEPWGIYGQTFSGSFLNSSIATSWHAAIGGNDPIGAYSYTYDDGDGYTETYFYNDYGYWIAEIDGTNWTPGNITGNLAGSFLTGTKMGSLTGQILGTHNDSGTWQGVGVGTWEGEPLTLSGGVGNYFEGEGSIYYNNSGSLGFASDITGLIGSTTTNWWDTELFPIWAMGSFTNNYDSTSCIWNSEVKSHNVYYDDNSTIDGGAFFGYTAGLWNNERMDGSMFAIFSDPNGNAGYMMSDYGLTGEYYSGVNIWKARGMLVPSILVSNLDIDLSDLIIDKPDLSGAISGNFGYGTIANSISGTVFSGNTAFIPSQEWGLYNLKIGQGNLYNNHPTNSRIWTATISGDGQFGDTAIRGAMMGDVYGTYSGPVNNSGDWVATSIGTWHRDEYVDPESQISNYRGFIGGVWDNGIIIGKMIALFTQPSEYFSDPVSFSGSGISGFGDIGNMAVDADSVHGTDINIESQPQGIWQFDLKGTMPSSATNAPFLFTIGGESEEGYWIGTVAGIKRAASNILIGSYEGLLLDLLDLSEGIEDDFDGNIYSGDVIGSLGSGTGTIPWQMVGLGEWKMQNWPEELNFIHPNSFGEFSSTTYLNRDALIGAGFGDFNETGSVNPFDLNGMTYSLTASYDVDGETRTRDLGWGIYYAVIESGNTYSNPSGKTLWFGVMGGEDTDHGTSYWLMHTSGTWQDGEVKAGVYGHALSDESLVTIKGDLFGLCDETGPGIGTWSATSVGSWVEEELDFEGEIDIEGNGSGFGYFNDSDPLNPSYHDFYIDHQNSSLSGLLGGTESLWTTSPKVTIMGEFSNNNNYKLLAGDFSGETTDGATFLGCVGGTALNNLLKGLLLAIYIRPDLTKPDPLNPGKYLSYFTGYIKSNDISGNLYPEIGMYEAEGTLTSYLDVPTLRHPEELFIEGTIDEDSSEGVVSGDVSGSVASESMHLVEPDGSQSWQKWSLWRAACGGTFTDSPSSDWHATATGSDEYQDTYSHGFSVWAVNLLGDKWSGNGLAGKMAGLSVGYEKGPGYSSNTIDLIEGSMIGTYEDASIHSWQALSVGISAETSFAEGLRESETPISDIDSSLAIGEMNGTGAGNGNFGEVGTMNVGPFSGKTLNFIGQSEGVWGVAGNGNYSYSATPAPGSFDWNLPLKGNFVSDGSCWLGIMSGTANDTPNPLSGDLELEGTVEGIYLKLNDDGTLSAGKIQGDVKGNYIDAPGDPSSGTWNTVAAGEWVEVESLLNNLVDIDDAIRTAADIVSIPITEVYSSAMTGGGSFITDGGGAITDVAMNMNFYAMAAYADGIWAAVINGNYNTPTNDSWTVNVSGDLMDKATGNPAGTVNATLNGNKWSGGEWAAGVSGTTDIGGSTAPINGVAAGTYTPPVEGTGTFQGAGTGTWDMPCQ